MSIPKKLVKLVLERDGFWCMIGGISCTRQATVFDHRANRGAGGSKSLDVPECGIAACWSCNGAKADAVGLWRLELESRGVIVPKMATNAQTAVRCAQTPVKDPWGDSWYLMPDGTRTPVGP